MPFLKKMLNRDSIDTLLLSRCQSNEGICFTVDCVPSLCNTVLCACPYKDSTKNRVGSHVWISPYTELHAPLRMSSRWAPGLCQYRHACLFYKIIILLNYYE